MNATTDVNEFKPEFTKKRAFGGVMLFFPVAESTHKHPLGDFCQRFAREP